MIIEKKRKKNVFGFKRSKNPPDPYSLLRKCREAIQQLRSKELESISDLSELKKNLSESCHIYYSLSAVSRRKKLDPSTRSDVLKVLFPLRSAIERRIQDALGHIVDQENLLKIACSKSFFGYSKKQGVSIRFPLMSCVPTSLCAGLCYAHDGRDRELHILFRAQLNYYVANLFEHGNHRQKASVFGKLDKAIDHAIVKALEDQRNSIDSGFWRSARIRFSHIGEMAALPNFSNSLAAEIQKRNSNIKCVMYSRHPNANSLDTNLFVINFSLDSVSKSRLTYAPKGSRIVSSGWDGETEASAEITFLEHHVEKTTAAKGTGWICPVSSNHDSLSSCDEAACDRCFIAPNRNV